MQTVIQGKEIETTYSVKVLRDDEGKIKSKPELVTEEKIIKWTDLFKVDGVIPYNSGTNSTYAFRLGYPSINISETEEVNVISQIYRVDLNILQLHTDKVVVDTSINKEEAETNLKTALAEYNRTVIEADEKMLAYCKLNNLDVETANIDDLKKVFGLNYNISYETDFKTYIKNLKDILNANNKNGSIVAL
jgi:hypothetical protein